jgi:Tol biopolymer transport system component/DNA-binding winged helix-turn-helix (wHTH) protein
VNSAEPTSEARLHRLYSFDDFTLDAIAGILSRSGEEIELRPKSLQVLIYLVERPGRLVERAELMQTVWPDVAVTDESVTRCVADIRKALGDESQRLIRTVPRRGYLFAAPVATPLFGWLPPGRTMSRFDNGPCKSHGFRQAIRLIAVVSATALVLVGFFGWRVQRASQRIEPFLAIPLNALPGLARYPSFSPDGDRLAFTWTGPKQDNADVYVQQIGAGAHFRLTTDTRNDYNPVWSPDGRWIAFLRRGWESGKSEVRLVAPLGGSEHKLTEIYVPHTYYILPPYLTWCPDSTCLVFTDSDGASGAAPLFLFSVDTRKKRQLTYPTPPATTDSNPVVSPDGHWLVFRRQPRGSRLGVLYLLPLRADLTAADEPKPLTAAALDAGYPTWLPNSKEILFSTGASEAKGRLWRLSVSAQKVDESVPLPFAGEDGLMPIVSRPQPGRASRLVYVRSFQDSNIWRVQTSAPGAAASASPVVAVASSRRESTPQLSPDGRRMAFVSDRSGTWEIWLADADGSNAAQLTFLATSSGAPCWSPDGQYITFQAVIGGQRDVYLVSAAGGQPRNLTSDPANDGRPSFSRDGEWIYFQSNRTRTRQIWKMSTSGSGAVQVTDNGAFAAFESMDGASLYYNQSMDMPSPVWRIPTAGGVPVRVLEGVVLGAFSVVNHGIYYIARPSGSGGLLYLDRPSGETQLQYYDFLTRRSTTVAHDLGNVFLGLTASKDGRTIFYSRIDSSLDDLMLAENFR